MLTSVDGNVFRGPRPDAGNFDAIKKQFAEVLSLEGEAEDAKEGVDLHPVNVYSFPIGFAEIYITGISQEYLKTILHAIDVAPKPLLVHCQHGEDRTGLIIAAYRVMAQGWTKQAAWSEALSFGYRDWLNFGINKTWRDFQ